MNNLDKAKIYRARFERLNSIPKKSERLILIISKVESLGLFFCFKHLLDLKINN
jgi:hypothetical protein